jgi:hypothetical protein
MRMIAADPHLLVSLTAAREMFARGYFLLGAVEKMADDQTVFGSFQSNYQAITSQLLESQTTVLPMGFVAPKTGS